MLLNLADNNIQYENDYLRSYQKKKQKKVEDRFKNLLY